MPLVPAFDMPFVHTPGEWRVGPLQAGPVAPLAPSVFDVGQIDQAPTPRAQVRPLYPPRARLHRIEGWVDLEFVVTAEGAVEDLRVLQTHPDDTFTRSALQSAARWTFNPGRHEGQPVPVRVHQRISFELE
jgi:protein TonB